MQDSLLNNQRALLPAKSARRGVPGFLSATERSELMHQSLQSDLLSQTHLNACLFVLHTYPLFMNMILIFSW